MRAWLLEDTAGPGSFRLGEVEKPEAGPDQVRVQLKAVGLNHLDLWVSHGLPKPPGFPHIAGADGAGVIDQVGTGASGWEAGDEVIIDPSVSCGICEWCVRDEIFFCRQYKILGEHLPGTWVESIVVSTRNLVRKPPAMPWELAGSFGLVTGTAYRMLQRARLQPGEVVLVVGVGGGVSSAAMLIARSLGARVFVTSRSVDKIRWATENGAEVGFESGEEFARQLKTAAGQGADVVIENVGPATWNQSLRSLDPGGRLVLCGGTSGTKVELHLPTMWFKQLEVIGSSMCNRAEFARATQLVASGKVPIPVDEVFAFDQLPAALARMEAGEQLGKLALRLE